MRHLLLSLLTCCTMAVHAQQPAGEYRNPIIPRNLPDPTVIKADDGYYYLYATENIRHLPIYRSKNLVDWDFATAARNGTPKATSGHLTSTASQANTYSTMPSRNGAANGHAA